VKPKIATTQSDTSLTVFTNGHHKPCHKNNHVATQAKGKPYTIPRPHSIHGHAGLTRNSTAEQGEGATSDPQYNDFLLSLQQRPMPQRSRTGGDVSYTNEEAGSRVGASINQFTPLDLPYNAFDTSDPAGPHVYSYGANYNHIDTTLNSTDEPQYALSAASDQQPHIDWSTYFTPAPQSQHFEGIYNQPVSYPTQDLTVTSHPDLTSSSSGHGSETDAYAQYPVSNAGYSESNNYAYSVPEIDRVDMLRMNSSSSYLETPPHAGMQRLTSNFGDGIVDMEAFLQASASNTDTPDIERISTPEHNQPDLHAMHGYTMQEAMARAHPIPTPESFGSFPQQLPAKNVSPWASIYDEAATAFDPSGFDLPIQMPPADDAAWASS